MVLLMVLTSIRTYSRNYRTRTVPLGHCLHNVTVKVNPVLDTARLSRRLEDRWLYENLHEHCFFQKCIVTHYFGA